MNAKKASEPDTFPTGLAAPARRALTGAGYTRLDQLNGVSEVELKKLHGIGPNALKVLKEALKSKGHALAE